MPNLRTRDQSNRGQLINVDMRSQCIMQVLSLHTCSRDEMIQITTQLYTAFAVHVVLSEAQRPADSRDIQAAQAGPSTAASVPQDVLQSGSTLQVSLLEKFY